MTIIRRASFGILATIVILGALLWWRAQRRWEIWQDCHLLQRYTPETEAAYNSCMREHGLDPEDWQ